MKRIAAAVAVSLALVAVPALAVQETFTSMAAADCSARTSCIQKTTDNLLSLFYPTSSPLSGPSATGFQVNAPYVDITAADPSKALSASIVVLSVDQSDFFNGAFYVGSVMLSTQDQNGVWTDRAVWSMKVGATPKYILLNGYNP